MQLGDYLKKHGISEREFASRIDTTVVTVNRYVNRKRLPSPKFMRAIEIATKGEVGPVDFYGGVSG